MGRMKEQWELAKDIAKDIPGNVHDKEVAMIRAKYLNGWMEICGVTRPEDIDYGNPHVHIQWLLCDPYWQRAIKNDRGRAEFLSKLTDEEREIYLTEGYAELENAKVTRELLKATKKKIVEFGGRPKRKIGFK